MRRPVVFFLLIITGLGASAHATAQTASQLQTIDRENAGIIRRDGEQFTAKATVSRQDSIITLSSGLGPGYKDFRIFGYERPDSNSRKMILISIFTSDVKNNPFHCPFGAYYQTFEMENMQLKYIGKTGPYIKARVIKNGRRQATVFILRRWIRFEQKD